LTVEAEDEAELVTRAQPGRPVNNAAERRTTRFSMEDLQFAVPGNFRGGRHPSRKTVDFSSQLTVDFERVIDLVPVDRVSPDFVAYLRFTLKERSLNSEFLILLQNHNSRFATRHLIGYN
jgi:hypothetical protein